MKKKVKPNPDRSQAFLALYQSFKEHFAKAFMMEPSIKWGALVLSAQAKFLSEALRIYGGSTFRSKVDLAAFIHRTYTDMMNETLKGVHGVDGFVVVGARKPRRKK